jgi:hypothetical protein
MLIARLSVDIALVILIWLVQIIIYPSFKYTDPKQFDFWHSRYMGLITYFVGPLMLMQVGIIGWQLFYDFHWIYLISATLIGLVWISTATISIPCHSKLINKGFEMETIQQLIFTNWYRTILWSIVLILSLYSIF